MKSVYIVIGSINYEGGYVVSVHASHEQARIAAKAAEAARNKSYFDRIKVEKFEVKQ